jgi:hypothetical protein
VRLISSVITCGPAARSCRDSQVMQADAPKLHGRSLNISASTESA